MTKRERLDRVAFEMRMTKRERLNRVAFEMRNAVTRRAEMEEKRRESAAYARFAVGRWRTIRRDQPEPKSPIPSTWNAFAEHYRLFGPYGCSL